MLTPINNAQFTAQIAAAFASKRVPDAMLVYSGGYTTPYMLSSLAASSTTVVNKTPGFYASQSAWDLSCLNLELQERQGRRSTPSRTTRAPTRSSTTRRCSRRPGIAEPPTTYKELLADCAKFKAKGILPLAYGDRDGYSTDNWVDLRLRLVHGRRATSRRSTTGKMKYADPKLVKPLEAARQVQAAGLRQPRRVDAREQRREHVLHLGQGRDGADVPVRGRQFEKALGKNLGLTHAAAVGPASWPARPRNSFHNWVIPKNAKQQGRRLGVHQDGDGQDQGAARSSNLVGAPPTNKVAAAAAQGSVRAVLRASSSEAAGAAARQHRAR